MATRCCREVTHPLALEDTVLCTIYIVTAAAYKLVLKLYGISSLNPSSWEVVDHDKDGPLAGTLTGEDGGMADEVDPLGLRGKLAG